MFIQPSSASQKIRRVLQTLAPWSGALVVVGALTALFGTYWDEAWHTDLGRDTFWSPPHMFLYAGPALVTMALMLWLAAATLQLGNLRAALSQGPLALGIVGAAVTIASAPVDDFWHEVFGRDAVLFSPPHTMGLVGILALFASVLIESTRMRAGRWLTTFTSAAILGGFVVLTFEWDADVPQFANVFYLPILSGAAALALGLVHRVARDPWIGVKAALIYTGLMAAVVGVLRIMGHSTPIVPALLLPAVAFDLLAQRRATRWLWAATFSMAIYATYVPYLNLILNGVYLRTVDAFVGLPLAVGLTWCALWLAGLGTRSHTRQPAAAALALTLAFVVVSPALAHDPGQGREIGKALIVTTVTGNRAVVQAETVDVADCASLLPVQITARRGGVELHSALTQVAPCRYSAEIELPERGRWFLYVELARAVDRAEAWTWVIASAPHSARERLASLYIPPRMTSCESPTTIMAAILLYAFNISVMAVVIRMFRREAGLQAEGV